MIYFSLILTVVLASFMLSIVSPIIVLKKESLFVDAISHSVLPSIVLAYFLTRSLDSFLFDFLAILFSFLTALLLKKMYNTISISKDSLIGLLYTFLFSIGVIMVVFFANDVHLDADAVLFGQLEYTIFSTLNLKFFPFLTFTHIKLAVMSFVLLLWHKYFSRILYLEAYDFNFIKFRFNQINIHNFIFYFVFCSVLIQAFKILGVVLVLSLLVAPGLLSLIFAKNIKKMFVLSLIYSVFSSLFSSIIAIYLNISIAGTVAFLNMIFLILLNASQTYFVHKNQG